MTTNDLISEIRSRNITVRVVGDKLRVSPPSAVDQGLAEAIREHKTELLNVFSQADMQPAKSTKPDPGNTAVLQPGYPFASIDHDTVFGDTPRYIQHKDPDCQSTEFWQHRWAGFFCCQCWPCTDAAMQVETNDQPTPKPDSQQSKRRREWTPEEQSLIGWFNQNIDSLPTEHFQDEINIVGLQQQLCYGPGYRDANKVIADLRLLKAEPERFHDLLEQRHLRNLGR